MQGKNIFTSTTAQQIRILLDKRISRNSVEKLEISKELGALGFFIHDFSEGLPEYDRWRGMTSFNFQWLVDDGKISIID